MIKPLCTAFLFAMTAGSLVAADDATLSWSNGDTLVGTLGNADDKVLTWHSPLFNDPLQINLSSLASVTFPEPKAAVPEDQGFSILMRNGDVLFGRLKSASEQALGFEGERFGTFQVARSQVLSLQRTQNSGGVIYNGPRGLDGWQAAFRRNPAQRRVRNGVVMVAPNNAGIAAADADDATPAPSTWTAEPGGSITTNRPDAALFLAQKLPEKFEIEIELHSKKMLSFVMAIGRDAKAGLRLESWIDVLVAANGTKFTTLQPIPEKEQTLHLHLFVDLVAEKMLVYSRGGQKLGEVTTTGLRGGAEGLTLRNGEWDLSLRRLRINNWDGTEPRITSGTETRIQLTDGTVHSGALKEFDTQSGLVRMTENGDEMELPVDKLAAVVFTDEASGEKIERGATQLIWSEGGGVSGAIASISDGHILIRTDYSKDPLRCSLTGAVRLGFPPAAAEATQSDRLFHDGGTLQGSLVVDGEAESPVQWKPLGGVNSSTLRNGGDARFVRGEGMTHFSENPEMLANFPDVVYLKNNDVLPCRVESCTEESLHLSMPFSETKSFARADVRAVELATTGRIHQKGFGAEGWKGVSSRKLSKVSPVRPGVLQRLARNQQAKEPVPEVVAVEEKSDAENSTEPAVIEAISLKGNASVSHPSILTGDTVRFHMKWPVQSYANLTVSLYGTGNRKDTSSTHVSFSLMQATLQVLDRAPPQEQMFFRGFGGQNAENIIRAPKGEVDIQIVARDGDLLVSVDGKQVKTIALNPDGAGSRGLAFNANVTMMGNVVINGRVQQGSGDGVVVSEFEIDNLSGASIRQFIEEESRQAALIIPRFRRDNPPTHVLVAANGDLLRGRMTAIRENDVLFESRLEPLRIDRQRVAAIVWLDPAKKDSGKKEAKPAPAAKDKDETVAADAAPVPDTPSPATAKSDEQPDDEENGFVLGDEDDSAMQALLADGFSITMTPDRLVNGQLKGHSRLLGECMFPAATIRELYIGDPKNLARSTPYDQWIAKHAQEPDWDIAAADGGNSAGASMIGQVADDFELPLLDGTKFRLKDHADKIIVLDFWATWCGPCVAALPDYIAATSEFDSSRVMFVAVNQQEASDQIRGFLTERELSPVVALDRDGAVGQKFQVSGIPHTVILGPGNVIEDVHVGYQQGGGESMQIAIQQMLDGTWNRPEPTEAPPNPAEAI